MATATAVQEDIIVAPRVYENPEVGAHVGTITRVEDLKMVKSDLYGEQHMIKIHIRIDDEKSSKNETLYVYQRCTLSLGKKARLGTFLRQLGIPTDGKFNLAGLVPMKINLGIVHKKTGDSTYANVEWVSPIRSRKVVVADDVVPDAPEAGVEEV